MKQSGFGVVLPQLYRYRMRRVLWLHLSSSYPYFLILFQLSYLYPKKQVGFYECVHLVSAICVVGQVPLEQHASP